MPEGAYELVQSTDGYTARIWARGSAVLATPTINRGTAFTLAERRELGLTGLLPTGVSTLEGQLRRVYAQYLRAGQRSAEVGVPGESAGPQRGVVLPAADRAHRGDVAGRLHPDGGPGDRAVQPRVPPPAPRGVPVGRPPRGGRDRAAQHRSRGRRTSTCWWPPTPKASSVSATRASAASRSPSASSPSTRRRRASTPRGCCRSCWTWARTTWTCSTTTCTWASGTPGSATSATTT